MTIIVILIVLIIIGLLLRRYKEKYKKHCYVLIIIGIVGLIIVVISVPISHIILNSQITEYNMLEKMLEEKTLDRNSDTQNKVIEHNQWLAKHQLLNSTILDIWIPDKVDLMKPLKNPSSRRFNKF